MADTELSKQKEAKKKRKELLAKMEEIHKKREERNKIEEDYALELLHDVEYKCF